MKEIILKLREFAVQLEEKEFGDKKESLEKDLQITKLERGNETLQEVIKQKDDAYKAIIETLKGSLNKGKTENK